jgi:uncharacterized small protein (DUF1192 family)
MAGLGDLAPMLNMMRQRKQDRANNEYRDSVLAQREDQLAYQKTQDQSNNEARNRQLAATEESVKNQTAQQANLTRAANALNNAYENKKIASTIIPTIGEGLTLNENGGFSVSDDSFEKLWANDKESVLRVMQQSPQFTAVRSPSGGEYETVKIEELGDDSYAVIVGNAETEGPLTEGGTTDDADPVIEFDGATLRRIFANGLGSMMADGGWESPQAQIFATMQNDAVIRADMAKLAARGLGEQTSRLGQVGDTPGVYAGRRALLDLNNASYDELAQMITDVHGMSAEDVAAQFPRPTQQSSTSQSSENPRLPSAAESGEEAIAMLQDMGLSFEQNEDGSFGAMIISENASPKLKDLQKGFESRRTGARADVNDPDSMTDAADQSRSRMAMSSAQKIQEYAAGLQAEIARLEAEPKGTGHTGRNKETKLKNARRDFEILNTSAITPESKLGTEENPIDPPDMTLTRENMIAKIKEGNLVFTDNQREQTSQFLQNAGVTTASDLGNIRSREATLAAAIIATSDASLNVSQQQELLQKLFNLAERGSMDYTLPNLIDDVGNQRTLNQRINELSAADTTKYENITMEVNEEVYALTLKAGAQGEDAVRWNDPTITADAKRIFSNFEDLPEGPAKLAYGRGAVEVMGIVLKKYAAEKDPGLFSSEWFQNIVRTDASVDYSIDSIIDRIVISPDGKTFGFSDTADNADIVEGEIPLVVAYSLFGRDYVDKTLIPKARQRSPVAM